MTPIKVVHITTVDSSLHYLLLNQLTSIRQDNYAVAGISSPGPDVPLLEAAGIQHIPVPMTRNFTPFADLVALNRLYWIMRQERFTIVHTHTPKAGLLGQLAAYLAGVPIIVNTLHGFYFHDGMSPRKQDFYTFLEKIAAHCSDVILSQNQEDIATSIKRKIAQAEKIKHLGNGIDLEMFDPGAITSEMLVEQRRAFQIPEDALVVGFVGRLAAKRKGFLNFLVAAQALIQQVPDVHFLIIGEADHGKADAVEASVATQYGIAERCHFLGQRPNNELPRLYSLMNVLVLPSLFEGIPRVIMEASAMGIPVVATDVKGNREAVMNGHNGFLVPLGEVLTLTKAIRVLLTNIELARPMGARGRQIALEQFDEQLIFQKVKAEYRRLLAAKGIEAPGGAFCRSNLT